MSAISGSVRPGAERLAQMSCDFASMLEAAADVAESAQLRDGYRRRAAAWDRFAAVLGAAIRDLGGPPLERSAAGGALQRAWIKIKSAIGDAGVIAAECQKREQRLVHRCAQLLESGMPAGVRDIIERHCREVAAAERGANEGN